MNPEHVWKECLAGMKTGVSQEAYKTWFEPTSLGFTGDREAVISTNKGEIHAGFLEEKYKSLIRDALEKVTGKIYAIRFIHMGGTIPSQQQSFQIRGAALNKEYTFENFIVGQSNEFAHSAALAVAESPGATKFNPLFIYGKSGLGKTHLLQAIGNYSTNKWKEKTVLYANSTQFMDQYIKSIENKKTGEFNIYYKNCDVLLIDDIQFLTGKQATQDTFFHIFNSLYSENKQIVISSDKVPKDLDGLEDRLISRFQSGLTVDIQPPTLETKIAIINKKAENNSLNLPANVIEFVAAISSTNIREMEGYILRLLAYSSINKVDIDYALAIKILDLKKDPGKKRIYVEEVIDVVARHFKIPKEKIIAGGRERDLVLPRQAAMYLSRKLTDSSLKSIGKIFTKDHSTVIHGVKTMENLMNKDANIRITMDIISKVLLEG